MPDTMGEKRQNSVHVRISDEADAVLELMSEASSPKRAKADIAAELIEESLLGRGHALKVAAMRFARLGLSGKGGES